MLGSFDANLTGSHRLGLFGVPARRDSSQVILLPVPWEVTTSYGSGTSRGPEAILFASPQIDLFDLEYTDAYTHGFFLEPEPTYLMNLNNTLKIKAMAVREELEEARVLSSKGEEFLREINAGCQEMVDWVLNHSREVLKQGKILGVVGGDHSSPLGAIQAVGEKFEGQYSVLHIDAHADLRESYQGFKYSHASIMYNVMNLQFRPQKLVQVGIRDFCEDEYRFIEKHSIHTFFDLRLKQDLFLGQTWGEVTRKIVDRLTDRVYISFDIDGLSPDFCPHTGTPVPGGLSFDQAVYLIGEVVRSGRQIVGFDLNEVAPGPENNEWDGNVGARVLFKLCCAAVHSQKNKN